MSSVCIPGNRHCYNDELPDRPVAQHDRCICGVDTDWRCQDTRMDHRLLCEACLTNCPKPGQVIHEDGAVKCVWCGDMVRWEIDKDHYNRSGMAYCDRAKWKQY